MAAGVAPPNAARRALAPKAWDASREAALAAALRGGTHAGSPRTSLRTRSRPRLPRSELAIDVPASLARAAEVADEQVAEAPADPAAGA